MKKTVYINGRFLCNKIDGITRFSLEICKQLKITNLDFKIIIPKWLEYENEHDFELVRYGSLKSHFWEQLDLIKFLKSNGNPLLVNLSGIGPVFYNNQIISIHDLSFFENKKWFSKTYTLFYSIATPIIAKKAHKIITVSNFSKKEIIKFLRIDKEKINVVYNAVSREVDYKNQSQPISTLVNNILSEKYILAVSSIDPRKNLQLLIDSFLDLKLQDYKLVLVGKSSSHFNIKLNVKAENIIFTGYVSDSDLTELYKKCNFFIYPSLYEGFGIPPLEAMANNCAVIVSDIPSLREVCSDAAIYVSPYEKEDVMKAISLLINDDKLKIELRNKGILRSQSFKWEDSGQKIFELIKSL